MFETHLFFNESWEILVNSIHLPELEWTFQPFLVLALTAFPNHEWAGLTDNN